VNKRRILTAARRCQLTEKRCEPVIVDADRDASIRRKAHLQFDAPCPIVDAPFGPGIALRIGELQ
jgi:hypothetical protein